MTENVQSIERERIGLSMNWTVTEEHRKIADTALVYIREKFEVMSVSMWEKRSYSSKFLFWAFNKLVAECNDLLLN